VADALFEEPRLAALYDQLHPDRRDLNAYIDLATKLKIRSVLDAGCGTGTLACLLAERGLSVTAVDPAAASIELARRKPHADRVHWLVGGLASVTPRQVELVTMTANVAQVFLSDDDWQSTIASVFNHLQPGGRFVFEVRDPAREAWRTWTRERTFQRHHLPEAGSVEVWVDLIEVTPPLISFRWSFHFESDDTLLTSDSTLRFRSQVEIRGSLEASNFHVEDVRDAPDRPGQEFVFLAKRMR
jgi:SAM-dependent methyltransferase